MSSHATSWAAAHAQLRDADRDAPKALISRQDRALERFQTHGIPSSRHEDWRYTNLRAFRDTSLTPAEPGSEHHQDDLPPGLAEVVLTPDPARLSLPDALPDGLRIRSLREVMAHDADALRGLTAERVDSAMSDLNDAFATDALILDVTAGESIAKTVLIDWRIGAARQALSSPRMIIRLGARSDLTLIERRTGRGAFMNALTDIDVGDGARLNYVDISSETAASQSVARVEARVGRDATFNAYSLTLGGTLNRIDTHVTLAEPGAQTMLGGTFLAAAGEHVDHHTAIHHAAGHTFSDEDYRGIIGRAGRGVFNGKVIVGVDAQRIRSAQSNDNLLLDDSARIDTKPELQIYADDVACSHGATVGRLDEQALFYLRSRGLDERVARRVLMDAFGQRPLAGVPASLRTPLSHLLNGALVRLSEDSP